MQAFPRVGALSRKDEDLNQWFPNFFESLPKSR